MGFGLQERRKTGMDLQGVAIFELLASKDATSLARKKDYDGMRHWSEISREWQW